MIDAVREETVRIPLSSSDRGFWNKPTKSAGSFFWDMIKEISRGLTIDDFVVQRHATVKEG